MTIGPYRIKNSIFWYIAAALLSLITSYLTVEFIYSLDTNNNNSNLPVIHFIEDRAK
jgi:hypothetical protein